MQEQKVGCSALRHFCKTIPSHAALPDLVGCYALNSLLIRSSHPETEFIGVRTKRGSIFFWVVMETVTLFSNLIHNSANFLEILYSISQRRFDVCST
jgi:hypothetical protein